MDTVFSHPEVTAAIAGFFLFGIIGKVAKFSFERIAKGYLYISIFAVLVVMTSTFFPFIGGKDYFFRFSVELAIIAFILWWAFEARAGELRARLAAAFKNPIVIAVSAFALAFLLAALFANDIHAAFWSNYERGEGAFQLLHYYAFFLLLALTFREEKDWKLMFRLGLVAAGGMILYGVLANFLVSGFVGPYVSGTVPATWWGKLIQGRFQGSLGNADYIPPFLMFSMFYAAYLWIEAKRSGKLNSLGSWAYGIIIAIFFFFFILSQTRGGFLGFGIGFLALLVYLIVAARGRMRKISTAILCAIVALGIFAFVMRNNPAIQRFPEARLLHINTADWAAQSRIWDWQEAWKGFLARPVLGWGPENFSTLFDKYFDPRFFSPVATTETWFDRAHSIFFDYLSETGILGFLSYLSIFALFYYQFIKKRPKVANGEGNSGAHGNVLALERGVMLALPIAYLVQGITIFDVLPMYINLFLFFAFAAYYFASPASRAEIKKKMS